MATATIPWRQSASRPEREGAALLTPAAVLSGYTRVAQGAGLNASAMALRVGLDPLCLTNARIPILASRATELIELSAIEAGVSDFGVRMALARGVPDIGPLTLLLREEPDLRSAVRSLQSHMHLHSRSVRVFLENFSETPILHASLTLGCKYTMARQVTEMINCSVVMTLRWLLGQNWAPEMVGFTHHPPLDARPQRRAFGCDVEYKQSFDGIVLRRSDLDQRIASSGPILRQHVEKYIRSLSRNTATEFVDTVSQLIAALLPSGSCSAAAVSRHLGIERTTLGRRLGKSGETFSSVLQRLRMELAAHYCANDWSLNDVADQLGFTSPSVFSRWFKASFGRSPSAWRKSTVHTRQ